MFRYVLFAAVMFALPHADWFPRRFGFDPVDVPLGLTNLILCVALVLWAVARATTPARGNPFPAVSVFLAILVAWTGVAFVSGYTAGTAETLSLAKRQVLLLALYFVPLAAVRDRRDFRVFFAIALAVHLLIGYEVFRTGVLGGSAFHDGKRASGPFGVYFKGADIAGAYLAQVLMLFLAIVLAEGSGVRVRVAAALGAAVVFLGVLATYSRGSLLAALAGFAVMVGLKRPRQRTLLVASAIGLAAFLLLPQSTMTRFQQTQDVEGQLDTSSMQRFTYYEAAWKAFSRHPMGAGTGQAPQAMKWALNWNGVVDPHNGFLQTLIQFGPAGLLVFLWMLGSVLRGAIRVQGDADAPPIQRAYSLGVMGMMGALVTCNLFYANFYKELVMGTVAIHLGLMAFVAQDRIMATEEAADEGDSPVATPAFAAATALPAQPPSRSGRVQVTDSRPR